MYLTTAEQYLAFDREHILHPYAAPLEPPPVFLVEKAHGTEITLSNGQQLTDAVSSWWCVAHGHSQPDIVSAIALSDPEGMHSLFAGLIPHHFFADQPSCCFAGTSLKPSLVAEPSEAALNRWKRHCARIPTSSQA